MVKTLWSTETDCPSSTAQNAKNFMPQMMPLWFGQSHATWLELPIPEAVICGLFFAVHILHLTFGFVYLIVNGIRVVQGKIHSGDVVRLESLSIYWHFMGALWLYLFAFLFYYH